MFNHRFEVLVHFRHRSDLPSSHYAAQPHPGRCAPSAGSRIVYPNSPGAWGHHGIENIMRESLAKLLKPVADGLSVIFVPAMWVLAVVHALLGLLTLISPNIAKGQIKMLHGSGRVRGVGLYLLVLGLLLFSQASLAANPVFPQAVAVVLFLVGGTLIALPALGLIAVEGMLDKGPGFFRFIALVNILVAILFYLAAQLRPVAPDIDDYTLDPDGQVEDLLDAPILTDDGPALPFAPSATPDGAPVD